MDQKRSSPVKYIDKNYEFNFVINKEDIGESKKIVERWLPKISELKNNIADYEKINSNNEKQITYFIYCDRYIKLYEGFKFGRSEIKEFKEIAILIDDFINKKSKLPWEYTFLKISYSEKMEYEKNDGIFICSLLHNNRVDFKLNIITPTPKFGVGTHMISETYYEMQRIINNHYEKLNDREKQGLIKNVYEIYNIDENTNYKFRIRSIVINEIYLSNCLRQHFYAIWSILEGGTRIFDEDCVKCGHPRIIRCECGELCPITSLASNNYSCRKCGNRIKLYDNIKCYDCKGTKTKDILCEAMELVCVNCKKPFEFDEILCIKCEHNCCFSCPSDENFDCEKCRSEYGCGSNKGCIKHMSRVLGENKLFYESIAQICIQEKLAEKTEHSNLIFSCEYSEKSWIKVDPREKKRESRESDIQKRLEKEGFGVRPPRCETGQPDLVNKEELIEIKGWNQWKAGVGQLLTYGQEFPGKKFRLWLFGRRVNHYEAAYVSCRNLGIFITEDQIYQRTKILTDPSYYTIGKNLLLNIKQTLGSDIKSRMTEIHVGLLDNKLQKLITDNNKLWKENQESKNDISKYERLLEKRNFEILALKKNIDSLQTENTNLRRTDEYREDVEGINRTLIELKSKLDNLGRKMYSRNTSSPGERKREQVSTSPKMETESTAIVINKRDPVLKARIKEILEGKSRERPGDQWKELAKDINILNIIANGYIKKLNNYPRDNAYNTWMATLNSLMNDIKIEEEKKKELKAMEEMEMKRMTPVRSVLSSEKGEKEQYVETKSTESIKINTNRNNDFVKELREIYDGKSKQDIKIQKRTLTERKKQVETSLRQKKKEGMEEEKLVSWNNELKHIVMLIKAIELKENGK